MNWLGLRNNRLKLEISRELSIIIEEYIENIPQLTIEKPEDINM